MHGPGPVGSAGDNMELIDYHCYHIISSITGLEIIGVEF